MRHIVRMMRAWFSGTYRVMPWRSLGVLILVGLYAINPIDLIPDYLPIIGVIDDAAIFTFLYRSLKRDAELFMQWESSRTTPDEPHTSS